MKKLLLPFLILPLLLVSFNSKSQVLFTDVAPTLGLNDPGNGQGVTFIDIDNDGYLDIFLDNNGSQNRLWKNNGGNSFTDVTAQFGLNFNGPGRGCSSADFDNDGFADLMVGNYNQTLILYKNTGSSFINFTTNAGLNFTGWGGSINWIDYNSDGKIDVMFANDGVPYHYNYLFRNDNQLSFTNVAYSVGLVDSTSTLCLATSDYDNDGDMDIFCGTQTLYGTATDFLYRNNGNGTYTDVTVSSGLITMNYTWGADWGDFDNDGYTDLYIGNTNGPNQLYKNNGNGTFTEVASQYGVADPTATYSCQWGDYDNDGDLDLYVANGSTGVDKLYRNDGSTFTDVAAIVGTNDTRHAACVSWGDINNDGFLDIYLVNNGTENRLYRSNAGNSNKWLIIKLVGMTSNKSAIGARVKLKTGNLSQIREVSGGSGGKGQNSLPVEFGIGNVNMIDSIIVRWPSGLIQRFGNVNPNLIYYLIEGQNLVSGLNQIASNTPNTYSLKQNYPNPFNPNTFIEYELPQKSHVTISIMDALGKEIETLVNNEQVKGRYKINFEGSNFSSGVYFYILYVDGLKINTKKMVLIK